MNPDPDEFEDVPEILCFLFVVTAVVITMFIIGTMGCSADVEVRGIPNRIQLVPGTCAPDAGDDG
jgi:hypothetical protein